MILRELTDQVKIENIAGEQINPASNEKLEELKAILDLIDTNTDTLEDKIQSIRNQLDVLLSTRSSESTSQSILIALGEGSGTNLLDAIQNISLDTSDLAKEATLIEVRDLLDNIETKLQSVLDKLDVNLSTRASENTLTLVLSQLDIKISDLRDAIKGSDNKDLTTLEEDVETILVQLDVVLSSRASESTLQSAVDAIGEASGTNLLVELQNIVTKLDSLNGIDFATEVTLKEIRDYVDTLETKIQSIIDRLDVNLSTRASENTLGLVLAELESIEGKDFATETTLALVKTAIDQINTDFDIALSTRASEATLTLIKTAIDAINTDLDVVLSTRSSESTLLLVKSNLDDIKDKLDILNTTDFATELTSAEIRDTIGQESGSTVLSKLGNIWDKLVSLFNDGIAKVQLWDGDYIARITSDRFLTTKGYGTIKAVELFENNSIDVVNKWVEVIQGSASKSFDGTKLQLNVTTGASDLISYTSKRNILPATGQSWNRTLMVIDIVEISDNNNIREWGVKNNNNGYLFRLQGNNLKVVAIIDGSEISESVTMPFSKTHKYEIRRTGLTQAQFLIDEVRVACFTSTIQDIVGNKYDTMYMASRNVGILTSPSILNIISCAVIDEASSGMEIIGVDDSGIRRNVATTSTGRLLVSQEPPVAPPDTTSINITEYGNIAGVDDYDYLIPSGETLIIQRFSAGAEPAGGSNIELWYDPDGTKLNMEILDVIFSEGQSDQHDLSENFLGDGTKRIIMRRTGLGSSNARVVFGRWEGYY